MNALGELPSLSGATGWLNSEPLTPDDLRGRVVLVDFWTFTCINWLRTLPHVRAWVAKYRDQGLVVIGVHTPEFTFERDVDSIRRETNARAIDYPVAIDSDYAVWRAFDNQYWPALYFADADSVIRHHHFGEEAYEESERVLQQLLTEAGADGVADGLVAVEGEGDEAPADWDTLRSPETYVGYARTENFASDGGVAFDERRTYALPERLRLGEWALAGDWTVGAEAVTLNEPGGRIAIRFQARDLHLVVKPADEAAAVRFQVRTDGQPPGPAHGSDVDEEGNGTVAEGRLHQLIRQPGPIVERTFEITFLDPGVEAYVFTFG
jgi:thiol-disulfide isomerase/thioredoxin